MALVIITLQDGDGQVGPGVQITVISEPASPDNSAAGELAAVALTAMRAHANQANATNN